MNKKTKTKAVKTFTSFEDLRSLYGLPPIRRQTRDKEKLKGQRQFFLSKHLCPTCNCEMEHIDGTNVLFCPNKNCDGFKRIFADEETDEKTIEKSIAFDILDDKGAKIANSIFAKLN